MNLMASAIAELHDATAIYTRDPVVAQLLDQIQWPIGGGMLVEPSCGDGAFLVAALTRLLDHEPALPLADVPTRLQGWEIYPGAAAEARERFAHALHARGATRSDARRIAARVVITGCFLREGPRTASYAAIVGNPPYRRRANLPRVLRDEYDLIVPTLAQADILYAFLERCPALLAPHGEVAFVTSDRWLFNENARKLRQRIGQHLRIARVEALDASSSFYRPKTHRRQGDPPRIDPIAIVLRPTGGRTLGPEPIYPRETEAATSSPRVLLGDVARVTVAPWLGGRGCFLITPDEAAALPRDALVPAVTAKDFDDGKPILRRYAIRTTPDETPAPVVRRHLSRSRRHLSPRARDVNCAWLPPEPFHDWDFTQACIVVPDISLTLSPTRLPAGILPVDHGLAVIRPNGKHSLDELENMLRKPEIQARASARAARVENGYRRFPTTLLRRLPVDP